MKSNRIKISGTHYKQLKREFQIGRCCVATCGYREDGNRNDLLVQTLQGVPFEELSGFLQGKSDEHKKRPPMLQGSKSERLSFILFTPVGSSCPELESTNILPETWAVYLCPIENFEFTVGRQVFPLGSEGIIDAWFVAGDDYLLSPASMKKNDTISELSTKHNQMFGDETTAKLRGLKIGVVGCSGTGGPVIEQLARLGVGHLILIDPDKVEKRNLNRIPNTTWMDAIQEKKKVSVFERAIAAIGFGTKVEPLSIDLVNPASVQAIASCDIIFGCMDSIQGRHVLNRISSYYLIPLIDVGVKLTADGKGGISGASGAVHCVQPGGSSLMSRKLYDSEDLRADTILRENPEMYRNHRKEGYIKNVEVESPAVISFNMQIAALGVTELLARIHPSMRLESNEQYAILRMNWMDAQLVKEPEPSPCPIFLKMIGKGDCVPPLGMPTLSRSRHISAWKVGLNVEAH